LKCKKGENRGAAEKFLAEKNLKKFFLKKLRKIGGKNNFKK